MSDRRLEFEAVVLVVHNLSGFKVRCRFCRAILEEGCFAIGLRVGDEDYLVVRDEPDTCCRQEQSVPLLFHDRMTAAQASQEIFTTVRCERSLAGVKLIECPPFSEVKTGALLH